MDGGRSDLSTCPSCKDIEKNSGGNACWSNLENNVNIFLEYGLLDKFSSKPVGNLEKDINFFSLFGYLRMEPVPVRTFSKEPISS